MSMEKKEHGYLRVFDAYRPTTFYVILVWLLGLAIIIYGILVRNFISLILLVLPLWLYGYVEKRMKPLHDSRFSIVGKDLVIEFRKIPRISKLSVGRLSVVHQVKESGEEVHVEFNEKSSVSYKLENPTVISTGLFDSNVYTGVRVDPTFLAAVFEDAYRLEYDDRIVYLGIIKPINLEIVDDAGFNASLDNNALKVGVRGELKPPIIVKSYSKCCGFYSKKVQIEKVEDPVTELEVKLGIPENTGIAIIPDKPYLPSLLGGILSSLNYPVSYVSNHPESELIVEIEDSTGRSGEIIIKPSKQP
ncbi:MAG: hypothetical protein F7B59_07635 [Desulfurococcales archaeon]|nr:hypothetical protein [Desulfurococcales archaeon]